MNRWWITNSLFCICHGNILHTCNIYMLTTSFPSTLHTLARARLFILHYIIGKLWWVNDMLWSKMIYHEYERDIQPPSPIINFCLKNQLFDIAIYLYIWDHLKLLLNGLNELLIFFLDLHSSSRLAFVSIFKNNTPCRW